MLKAASVLVDRGPEDSNITDLKLDMLLASII